MKANAVAAKDTNEYISAFPKATQKLLIELRAAVRKAAPEAEEMISYQMPAYKFLGRPLVYFGGYERHIGFYPTPSGVASFEKELSKYKRSKGAVQFPLDEPLPISLITKIVKFRIKEAKEKESIKLKKK